MAITLVATPKAANANTYATQAESVSYHETHLYASAWDDAVSEKQKAALVWATRLLDDSLDFEGWRTTTTQKLSWPRIGIWTRDNITVDDDVIPQFLINATSELARTLLEADRTAEPDTKGFSKISVGPISLSVDKLDSRLNPIPDSVMEMLHDWARFARASSTIKVVRT